MTLSALIARAVVAVGLVTAATTSARAGGGGENVLLVVNQRSWSSLTVANHFIRLRSIPAVNVVYVDWNADNEQIDAETFRAKLLNPVTDEIDRRRLNDHIDYIVYSTDFPWIVDCTADAQAAGAQLSNYFSPYASLTGATFLYQSFLQKRIDYLSLDANKYFQKSQADGVPLSRGFRSWYGWAPGGDLLEAGGERFAMSTMLGVSSGRGNSVAEIVKYLTVAAEADGTRPAGTIYYAENDDVRSETRERLFRTAVEAIRRESVKAEIVKGILPVGKPDVAGAMIGAERFDWRESSSRILPGAFCEHLTSSGGVLFERAGQSPLTDSLRAGAAASCGAVTEPYAVPHKFPNAFMHLHYVRGCTAAEAYYQAIQSPYQLIFVGDPLCRPWAAIPAVALGDFDPSKPIKGPFTLTPTASLPAGHDGKIGRFEFFVDGVFIDACRPSDTLYFDTTPIADGHHELRVVAVCAGPIETRGTKVVEFTTANQGHTIQLTRRGEGPVVMNQPLVLEIDAPGALGAVVIQGTRKLGVVQGPKGNVTIDPRQLGLGLVALQAVGIGRSGTSSNVISSPLRIEVEAAPASPSYQIPGGAKFEPAMRLDVSDGVSHVITAMPETWLEDLKVVDGKSYSLVGYFTVEETANYQLRLKHNHGVSVLIDDRAVLDVPPSGTSYDYAAASLRRGLHKLEIRGTTGPQPRLEVRFGLRGTRQIQPASMTHVP